MIRSRKTAKRQGPDVDTMLAAYVQDRFEAEKARIARRLHDDVAGMLAAARMDLSRMAGAHAAGGELREQVARVDQILETVIHSTRNEMQRLHPALLDHFGLSAALRYLVEHACRVEAAEYVLDLPESADAGVPAPVALAVYRVVESLLAARAPRRVQLRLRKSAARVRLQLEIEGSVPIPRVAAAPDLLALRAWLEALGAVWSDADRELTTDLVLEWPHPDATTA